MSKILYKNIDIKPEVRQLISPEMAWKYEIIPESQTDNQLNIFVNSGFDEDNIISELKIILGKNISFTPIDDKEFKQLLLKNYPQKSTSRINAVNTNSDNFVEELVIEAYELGASDIHFEPFENKHRVRFRIDGTLVERYALNASQYPAIVNKIKILANLDISEKRLPQDGRINFVKIIAKFDIRVSTLPALFGEKIVLRILTTNLAHLKVDQLGLDETDLVNFKNAIQKPHGIILISGPTGSGKTTTLYATLKELNKNSKNILTIEDPVEYTLEGINQVQLKSDIGLDFATALKTFLRQDPDIIMVGEIRDAETAKMAIRAALTGHLVLSTIHTNSASGTISRLLDMGIPSFLVSNTLNISIAQRLVRVLCECKKQEEFDPGTLNLKNFTTRNINHHYTPNGCEKCLYTGYKGRQAIYEVIPITNDIKQRIKSESQLETLYNDFNIKSLAHQAFKLATKGITSFEEIFPFLNDD